jgi:hypothetical protein
MSKEKGLGSRKRKIQPMEGICLRNLKEIDDPLIWCSNQHGIMFDLLGKRIMGRTAACIVPVSLI